MTTNNQTSIASLTIKRRTYSAEFKQQIVQACKASEVSIASVALQHGLNTNLVTKAPLDSIPTDMLTIQIILWGSVEAYNINIKLLS